MATKNYTTKTAALKATIADVNKLETKKIKVNGKDVATSVKHPDDTREVITENDLWGSWAEITNDGEIIFHDDEVTNPNSITMNPWFDEINSITKLENNKLYTAEGLYANIQTEKIKDGTYMFYYSNLESFDSDLSSLEKGHAMFCSTGISEFTSNLSSLTNGIMMFQHCQELKSFDRDLSSLTDGGHMFGQCSNLSSFSSDLSSLTDGRYMFEYCENLESFSSDLSSLTNGRYMFYGGNIKSFNSNLSSMTDGSYMFSYNFALSEFNSDLSSLTNGECMFYDCKLDAQSVANIVHALQQRDTKPTDTFGEGNIFIGISCHNTEEDQLLFAQECDCETWQELLDEFDAKNWIVTFQCKGRLTTTYNMRRGENLPIYTKLEEVIMPTDEKERKPHYAYTSADGSRFYNISYFHSTNGSTEGYDVFSSLEEAISTYNVTPKN